MSSQKFKVISVGELKTNTNSDGTTFNSITVEIETMSLDSQGDIVFVQTYYKDKAGNLMPTSRPTFSGSQAEFIAANLKEGKSITLPVYKGE